MRRQTVVLVLLLGGPGLIGLAGCGASDDPEDRVMVDAAQATGTNGRTVTALVPNGAVVVTVGAPVDEVAASNAADGESHDAPSGRMYLPVQTAVDTRASAGVLNTADTVAEPLAVALAADGERFDLPAPYTVGEDGQLDASPAITYVPVRSDQVDDWEVAITYDGAEQRLGPDGIVDAGAAAAFYDGAAAVGAEVDCSEPWEVADDVEVSIGCGITPTTTPYLPGPGWAEEGQIFIRADLRLIVSDATRKGRTPRYRDLAVVPSIADARRVQPAAGIGLQPPTRTRDTIVKSYYFVAPITSDPRHLTLTLDIWGIPASSLTQLTSAGSSEEN